MSAFLGAAAVYAICTDRAATAVAGTVFENVGFYGMLAILEYRRQRIRGDRPLRTAGATARLLVAEFGVAEVLDSTLLRPLLMYLGPALTGGIGSGTVLGKLLADVAFYGLAITAAELVRRHAPGWTPVDLVRREHAGRRPRRRPAARPTRRPATAAVPGPVRRHAPGRHTMVRRGEPVPGRSPA